MQSKYQFIADNMSLLDIPLSLVGVVLIEWLDIPSMVRFDSACCERTRRRELILNPTSPKPPLVVNNTQLLNHWCSAMFWFTSRNISIKNVVFNFEVSSMNLDRVSAFLDVSGNALEDVTVKLTEIRSSLLDSIIKSITSRASRVLHFNLQGCTLTVPVLIALSKLPALHSLSIQVASTNNSPDLNVTLLSNVQFHSLVSLSVVSLEKSTWSRCDTRCVELITERSSVRHLKLSRLLDLNVHEILKSCSNLLALSLANSQACVSSIGRISELCPHIEHLDLTGLWIGEHEDQVCRVFQNLPLRSLCVNQVRFSDAMISALEAHLCDTLCVLYMCDTSGFHNSAQFLDAFQKCTNLHTLVMTTSQAAHFSIELNATGKYDCVAHISVLSLMVDGSFEAFTPDFYNVTQLSANFHTNLRTVASHCHSTTWLRTKATNDAFVDQLETLLVAGVSDEDLAALRALYPHTLVRSIEPSFFDFDIFSVEHIV